MRLVHLSDLHFSTETPQLVLQLSEVIAGLAPDLVVVSGDFTQTGSRQEFASARGFLDRLPAPAFCVPGNHDIPRFDLWERFSSPYKKYQEFIGPEMLPVYKSDEVTMAGLNSSRPVLAHWNWANGAISAAQREHLKAVYQNSGAARRVCVFHHPIQEALGAPIQTTVFGARETLRVLHDLRVDLVLTGHVHHASVTTLGDIHHKTLYLSASTALSSRLRQQENGFNLIDISLKEMEIRIFLNKEASFVCHERYQQRF